MSWINQVKSRWVELSCWTMLSVFPAPVFHQLQIGHRWNNINSLRVALNIHNVRYLEFKFHKLDTDQFDDPSSQKLLVSLSLSAVVSLAFLEQNLTKVNARGANLLCCSNLINSPKKRASQYFTVISIRWGSGLNGYINSTMWFYHSYQFHLILAYTTFFHSCCEAKIKCIV